MRISFIVIYIFNRLTFDQSLALLSGKLVIHQRDHPWSKDSHRPSSCPWTDLCQDVPSEPCKDPRCLCERWYQLISQSLLSRSSEEFGLCTHCYTVELEESFVLAGKLHSIQWLNLFCLRGVIGLSVKLVSLWELWGRPEIRSKKCWGWWPEQRLQLRGEMVSSQGIDHIAAYTCRTV